MSVCQSVADKDSFSQTLVCVFVCGRERVFVCVCVCVCERVRESVCVCVCV